MIETGAFVESVSDVSVDRELTNDDFLEFR